MHGSKSSRVVLSLYRSLREASLEQAKYARERAITARHLRGLVDRAKIQFAPTQKHLKHQLSLLDEADAYQVGGVHADFIPERVQALFRKHGKFQDPEQVQVCINDGFSALRTLLKSIESLRDMPTSPRSDCLTSGVRVTAESYPDIKRTVPSRKSFVFNYKIHLHNEGDRPCRLLWRKWTISDGEGLITDEVSGPGVVGDYPSLSPGDRYVYRSSVEIGSPRGSMRGSYTMVDEDGKEFPVTISPFALDSETTEMIVNRPSPLPSPASLPRLASSTTSAPSVLSVVPGVGTFGIVSFGGGNSGDDAESGPSLLADDATPMMPASLPSPPPASSAASSTPEGPSSPSDDSAPSEAPSLASDSSASREGCATASKDTSSGSLPAAGAGGTIAPELSKDVTAGDAAKTQQAEADSAPLSTANASTSASTSATSSANASSTVSSADLEPRKTSGCV